jgi:hypothetical protein
MSLFTISVAREYTSAARFARLAAIPEGSAREVGVGAPPVSRRARKSRILRRVFFELGDREVRAVASAKSLVVLGVSIGSLAGCGGQTIGPSAETAYDFVQPVVGSVRVYSETIVDNSKNTIDIGFSQTVTAVSSSGIEETSRSTTGASIIVNGTNYAVMTEHQTYNDDSGQETSYGYTSTGGTVVTCTYNPHADGPDYPLMVGRSWQLQYTLTCGSGEPVTYQQSGTVVDVESVTVPAGTFNALKLQSTVTWTDADGTARTQTITAWRDIETSHAVKQDISIAVSGTLPTTGYALSRAIVLKSMSGAA